ncbi:MAG: hypothetical protein CK532_02580 [Flavobacteriales bacterium]|nr:MAG: hypothetical protein CK532_02580 [Flavobacteriales bacterium]
MKKTLLSLLIIAVLSAPAFGNKPPKKKKGAVSLSTETKANEKSKEAIPSIESKTKNCTRLDGLFTLFQDSADGKLYLMVNAKQLNTEFIHFAYTENGVIDAGLYRGQYRDSRIFTITKFYGNLEFSQINTHYYFEPNSPLAKGQQANISNAPLAFEKIIAENKKTGDYLVDADELFLTEKLHQIKEGGRPGSEGFKLGSLAKGKTQYIKIKNYPENSDLVVRYVYDNPAPSGGGEDIADPRSVSIELQHSILSAPKNNFKPRYDDPRVGYFSDQVNDMTSINVTNYRDVIHRWDLQKKDTTALLSEPVKPIVWWIENTTPLEYRQTIKKAALQWNKAFEPIGFLNAVQVFEQPDTAKWDAGDIRYNVLRWTSSPNPPFGGYGPSFTNPRTGEILGADIMFEYIYLTNRYRTQKLFKTDGGQALRPSEIIENSQKELNENSINSLPFQGCYAADCLHNEHLFASTLLAAQNASEVEKSRLINESIYYLVLHEMGHTMGLMHNMKASQLHTPAELSDPSLTYKTGLIGSVMDYPAINLNKTKNNVQYCQTEPGPYDLWAIEFGYSQALGNPTAEAERMRGILEKCLDPKLVFGNDADDMRAAGKGIDPRVMVNDLSNDAIGYGIDRIEMTQDLMKNLRNTHTEGEISYQAMLGAFASLSSAYASMVGIMSRYIGGLYVNRAFPNQVNAPQPYEPVPYFQQKRAMESLAKYAFAPNAMEVPAEIIPYLQQQRRGFGFFAKEEDPKLLNRVSRMQAEVLAHLLNPKTLMRISDTKEYGNRYGLSEMMGALTNAIFNDDLKGSVTNHRMVLQEMYLETLLSGALSVSKNPYDAVSKAAMYGEIVRIHEVLKANPGVSETKSHRTLLLKSIEKAQNN